MNNRLTRCLTRSCGALPIPWCNKLTVTVTCLFQACDDRGLIQKVGWIGGPRTRRCQKVVGIVFGKMRKCGVQTHGPVAVRYPCANNLVISVLVGMLFEYMCCTFLKPWLCPVLLSALVPCAVMHSSATLSGSRTLRIHRRLLRTCEQWRCLGPWNLFG